MRLLIGLVLCGALAVAGCSDDNNNNGGSGGTAGSGGAAGDGGAGGAAGMGGQGGSGGMSAAKAFCDDYASICGFDSGGFTSQDDCEAGFDGFSEERQACVVMHLGFAEGGDTATHCPHAAGAAPCN
jgi:hypothetical protein